MNSRLNPNISANELVSACEEDVRYFSSNCKEDRERWVFDHWCNLTGRDAAQAKKGEAPNFTLNSEQIEIVEIMSGGRKRHQEAKATLASANARPSRAQIHDASRLETIQREAHYWFRETIVAKNSHYGPSAMKWTLLIYVNFPFADRVNWAAVRSSLSVRPVGFLSIEALMPDGQRCVVLWPHP